MHLLAFITLAAFWSVLPVKLVAIAGVAYVLVQIVKRFFPAVTGPWAVALNVALSLTGVIAAAKPGDLEDPAFWSSLILTAASAAGIHGTVRSALQAKNAPANQLGAQ
jgi:hypothetical protein